MGQLTDGLAAEIYSLTTILAYLGDPGDVVTLHPLDLRE